MSVDSDSASGSDYGETWDEDFSVSSSSEYNEENESDDGSFASDDGDVQDLLESAESDAVVEVQIEGEFDRLIGSIRNTDDVSATPMLSKIWDAPLMGGDEMDFHDDLRAASGIGRRNRGTKRKRSRRSGPVLSHEVRALIGQGNQAYVDGEPAEAIRIMQEVIRIEPRAAAAWSVLTTCHRDIGEPVKALQLSVMGAHLRHDPDEWQELAIESRSQGYNQQALYCYRKAYELDHSNVDALWDRAELAKSIGELRVARSSLLAMLKRFPNDINILSELRNILVELSELDLCTDLFQAAFDYYTAAYVTGMAIDEEGFDVQGGGFGPIELLVLADLYNTIGKYDEAIKVIRSGCRWLNGRAAQRFWDTCPDDREYDLPGHVRENAAVRLQPGFYPLDLNARHRLAISRLKLGDIEEGKMHADIILSQNVTDFAPLFTEIADAYFEQSLYSAARPIYESLGTDEATTSIYVLIQAAACRRHLGDLKEAAEIYEHVIAADASNSGAKMKLAEIYEIMNEPRRALELVYQVIDARKSRRSAPGQIAEDNEASSERDPGVQSSFIQEDVRPKSRKPSKAAQSRVSRAELEELELQKQEEVKEGYARLKELWPAMQKGEEAAENEWLLEAEKLVEGFRESRILFMSHGNYGSKHRTAITEEAEEEDMASRLQLDLALESIARKAKASGKPVSPTEFRSVSFDNWLELVIEYSFLLCRRRRYEEAEEVLRHVLLSGSFQSPQCQDVLRLSLITYGIHRKRYDIVIEQSRKLIHAHQFNNEPVRVLLAGLTSGLLATDAFVSSPFQKHMLRESRVTAAIVRGKAAVWNPRVRRYVLTGGDDIDEDEQDVDAEARQDIVSGGDTEGPIVSEKPTKTNPLLSTVYGFTCGAVKSYQSALFHFLVAYETCRNDPVLCLGLATASIGRAMQRQSDNRNYLVVQGMGFMANYRKYRMLCPNGPHEEEIEYNFGRAFHQLGLFSHALHHYERVLELAELKMKENSADSGVVKEAAYNMSLILVTTGATPLAETLYRTWLSV